MCLTRTRCLLLLAIACTTLSAQQLPPGADAQIRQLIARYMYARNHKDPTALDRLFTPDADQLVSTGQWRRGLDNLVSGMKASSQKESGQNTVSIETIRALDPGTAIVDGRYQTTSATGQVRKMWTTFVVVQTASGWRIAAIRNMLPALPAS